MIHSIRYSTNVSRNTRSPHEGLVRILCVALCPVPRYRRERNHVNGDSFQIPKAACFWLAIEGFEPSSSLSACFDFLAFSVAFVRSSAAQVYSLRIVVVVNALLLHERVFGRAGNSRTWLALILLGRVLRPNVAPPRRGCCGAAWRWSSGRPRPAPA